MGLGEHAAASRQRPEDHETARWTHVSASYRGGAERVAPHVIITTTHQPTLRVVADAGDGTEALARRARPQDPGGGQCQRSLRS
jgi:hypothetical protein